VYTLFGIVLLSEWDIVRHVAELHPFFVLVFVLVVVFVTFGVLNVIIGILFEKTTAAMETVREQAMQEAQAERKKTAHSIADVLFVLDVNEDGRVSVEELEKGAEDERFRELLSMLDLPLNFTCRELVYALDNDGDGWLSREEFVDGLLRLIYCSDFHRDCIHSMSVGALHASLRRMQVNLKNEVKTAVAELQQNIQSSKLDWSAGPRSLASAGVVETDLDFPHASGQGKQHEGMVLAISAQLPSSQSLHSNGEIGSTGAAYTKFQATWEPLEGDSRERKQGQLQEATAAKTELGAPGVWLPLRVASVRIDESGDRGKGDRKQTLRLSGAAPAGLHEKLVGFVPVMSLLPDDMDIDNGQPSREKSSSMAFAL
jgi:hypothetical protein